MKTKFYWVALLASAAMIAQAKAGGHYGGGGGFAMAAHPAPAHAAAPAFQPAARGNFGGGRYIAPGAHVSSYYGPTTFRQQRFVGSDRTFSRSFATGTTNRRFDRSRTVIGRETRLTRNGIDSRTAVPTSGASVSLRDAQRIGIVIGTGAAIIGGMDIVATSSTASGSST